MAFCDKKRFLMGLYSTLFHVIEIYKKEEYAQKEKK